MEKISNWQQTKKERKKKAMIQAQAYLLILKCGI